MAKQDSILKFTGRLGGMIGYVRNGVHCVRSAPQEVKQTAATRNASKDFGQASKTACMLRYAIEAEVSLQHDRGVNNRLNKAMAAILRADSSSRPGRRKVTPGNLQQLKDFRLNKHAGIKTEVAVQRTFNGSVSVTCAAPLLQFEGKAQQMQFRAIAIIPDFGLGSCKTVVSEAVMLTREQAEAPLELNLPLKAGQTAIVILEAIAYRFFYGKLVKMGYRQYNATDIVAVVPGKKELPVYIDHQARVVDAGKNEFRYRDIRNTGIG